MSRLALLQAPFRSHVGLSVRLAATLREAGHEVTVFAPELARAAALDHGLRDVRPDPRAAQVAETLAALRRPPGHPTAALATRVALAEATATHVTGLTDELLALAPDVILGDALAPWSRLAARWLGIPHATVAVAHTLAPTTATARSTPAPPRDPDLVARLRTAARVLAPIERLSRDVPERTVAFTSPRLSGDLFDPARTAFVGPLAPPRPAPHPADEAPPLVYVSLGTVATERPALLRAVLDGLADRPVRVRLVTWRWLVPASLGDPPANAEIVTEADQLHELDHAAAFVTHAGVNSVLEALLAGVPTLCVPGAGDQFAGAGRVSSLGAGITPDASGTGPQTIAAAVDALLAEPSYAARARELGDELRAIDGAGAAGRLIDELTAG